MCPPPLLKKISQLYTHVISCQIMSCPPPPRWGTRVCAQFHLMYRVVCKSIENVFKACMSTSFQIRVNAQSNHMSHEGILVLLVVFTRFANGLTVSAEYWGGGTPQTIALLRSLPSISKLRALMVYLPVYACSCNSVCFLSAPLYFRQALFCIAYTPTKLKKSQTCSAFCVKLWVHSKVQ